MKKLTLAAALLALLGTTAMAQQTTQSQQTGRAGVSGSNTTINSGGMTSSGMRDSTTGMNAGRAPGSPAAAPKATTGPNGEPSNNETPPK